MIITTSARTNSVLIHRAKEIAVEWGEKFYLRGRDSIEDLHIAFNDDVLVVGKDRIELYLPNEKHPIFFHPNSAMFRVKRLINGNHDPLIDACKLTEGMSFLDCTLGLGSDSIVASFGVGERGSITSLEGNKAIAHLVKTGLKTWESQLSVMDKAMRAITVEFTLYQEYLKTCKNHSIDVIYFDPMFEESIQGSAGLVGVKKLALYDDITKETIQEAKRVAIKRIVLKDHWKSHRFEKLGFTPIRRKSANFHYGVIELG
jgi:16S rRNA G966 N2-methylase RsmD